MRTASSKKLAFAYDYVSWRVHKQVFGYDIQTSNWEETADTDLKFVYDGWTLDTPGNPAGAGFE